MVEALVCTQDWLLRTTPINIYLGGHGATVAEEEGKEGRKEEEEEAAPLPSILPPPLWSN
jgi:hypothetical protein